MTVTTPKKQILVDGRRMVYVERGRGVPLLFLRRNPTSSYTGFPRRSLHDAAAARRQKKGRRQLRPVRRGVWLLPGPRLYGEEKICGCMWVLSDCSAAQAKSSGSPRKVSSEVGYPAPLIREVPARRKTSRAGLLLWITDKKLRGGEIQVDRQESVGVCAATRVWNISARRWAGTRGPRL